MSKLRVLLAAMLLGFAGFANAGSFDVDTLLEGIFGNPTTENNPPWCDDPDNPMEGGCEVYEQ